LIRQLLNRQFVLARLQEVHDYLSAPAGTRRAAPIPPPEAETVSADDLEEALLHTGMALASEANASSGQTSFNVTAPAERRGEAPASIDDYSFFSREMVVSHLQYALERYYTEGPETRRPDERAGEPQSGGRRGADVPVVAERSLPIGGEPTDSGTRRIFDQFSITDPGWVSSVVAMGVRLFRKRHKFVSTPPAPVRIANNARIVVLGDWGSGLPRAQQVAARAREVLDEGIGAGREQHVLHLGDVYYSGWQKEYEDRFVPFWPVRPGEAGVIGSYSLNGNHDMYAGGFGYFDYLLADPRFARQAGCSYFNLFNDHWNLLNLDTAWDDNGLKEPQAQWVADNLSSTKKNMLLSHHQPFSAYEGAGTTIPKKLRAAGVLSGGKVRSWWWGHEHRNVAYVPNADFDVMYGRLLGHSGVPVYAGAKPNDGLAGMVQFAYDDFITSGLEHWTKFGFAVLDFADDKIGVRYISEEGVKYFEEVIE
jgi:hypothetical protein